MAFKTITSKIAPVIIGAGRMKSTTYIATKVSGPNNLSGVFTSEIIQFDNASGGGEKTIGNRDASGNINWNNNASGKIKLNTSKFKKASNNQISSLANELATSAVDKQALNAASGKGNQDNTDGNTDSSQSKPTPKPRDEGGGFSGSGGASKVPRNSYDKGLCYPVAMRTGLKGQDIIKIDVLKFSPKKMSGGVSQDRWTDSTTTDDKGNVTVTESAAKKKKGAIIGSVILPVPTSVNSTNQASWDQGTMTAAQMAMANMVKTGLSQDGLTGAAAEAQEALSQARTDSGATKKALGSFFTEQLTGTSDMLTRTSGMVQNPNMELLFKGPQMRAFSFSWKMSPRDEKESIVIAKIIRMFKQSMAPQKTEGGLFLKSPNIYQLTFQQGTKPHKFLPKMKECALTNCAVNFTPDGSYMTYDNTAMVSLEMSLSFQEMEPIYNNDMSHDDDSIGF